MSIKISYLPYKIYVNEDIKYSIWDILYIMLNILYAVKDIVLYKICYLIY